LPRSATRSAIAPPRPARSYADVPTRSAPIVPRRTTRQDPASGSAPTHTTATHELTTQDTRTGRPAAGTDHRLDVCTNAPHQRRRVRSVGCGFGCELWHPPPVRRQMTAR